jgi:hypothetical protein
MTTYKYTSGYKFIKVTYMDDDSIEYVTGGDVTDDELDDAINADGAPIKNYCLE